MTSLSPTGVSPLALPARRGPLSNAGRTAARRPSAPTPLQPPAIDRLDLSTPTPQTAPASESAEGIAATDAGKPDDASVDDADLKLLLRALKKFRRRMARRGETAGCCGEAGEGFDRLERQHDRFMRRMETFGQGPARETSAPAQTGATEIDVQVPAGTSMELEIVTGRIEMRVDESSGEIRVELQRVRLSIGPEPPQQESDPLVLDLDGDGIDLRGPDGGARFDIAATGRAVATGFVQGDDALLALDRTGNGRIDDGRELFGDQNGSADGFAELSRHDDSGDGRIDADDTVYAELRLWQDLDRNGQSARHELFTLAEKGIEAIELNARAIDEQAGPGGRLVAAAQYVRNDGTRGTVADAMFRYVA